MFIDKDSIFKRLCFDATSLFNHLKDLRSWFCNRGYPESMVKEQLRRAENGTRDELLCTNSCVGNEVGVPLLVTYHPHHNGLNKIMWKNLKHLLADQTVKLVFTPAHNLESHLAFTLCNVQLVPANVILLAARLAKL